MVIQRIQTLYLFLAFIALVVAMFMPVGVFIGYGNTDFYEFYPLYVVLNGVKDYAVAGLFSILGLSAIIALGTIFCYKDLLLQIRLSIFNIVMMIGYYGAFGAMWWIIGGDLDASFKMNWALGLPIVSLILTVLAIRGMGHDRKLLRDANSMRLRD